MFIFKTWNSGKFYLLVLGLLISQLFIMYSQMRPRAAKDSIQANFNGMWYKPEFDQFELQYPKLTTLPPLSTGMDFETMISYILLDSLMRSVSMDTLNQKYTNRWNEAKVKNDTIINAVKYLYKIVDADPIRYNQYRVSIGKSTYKTYLQEVDGSITDLLYNIIGNNNTAKSLKYLLRSDYILKIHINSIDSLPTRNYPPMRGIYPGQFTYRVNASVIDTLKGKVFQNCYTPMQVQKIDNIQTVSSEICFTYGTGPYENDVNLFKLDPSLKNSLGNLKLQAGQDAVVFLSHGSYLWDSNYDYFNLSMFNIYPIIGGDFKDVSNVWSSSNSLNYGDWKTIFNQKKAILLNGGY